MAPLWALLRRALADARVRTLSFALFFALYTLANVTGYERTFPTAAERAAFAGSLANSAALKLFYGTPHAVETVGGYMAWRVGGFLALGAAFFGLWGAVRALRSEEEKGRAEVVAAGVMTRQAMFLTRLAALGLTLAVLWAAIVVATVSGLPAAGAAYFALAVIAPAALYTGVGALTSQLAPTGRGALELGGALLGLDFIVRVVADTAGLPQLHALLPLGWQETLRPFTGTQPVALLAFVVVTTALLVAARLLEARRDIGSGLLGGRESGRPPRLHLLGSPAALALRMHQSTLAVWAAGCAGFAAVLGSVAKSVVNANLSEAVQEQATKLGARMQTAAGYVGLSFLFFILAISFYCCSQVGALRDEEAEGRLEVLFARPVSRTVWFTGRLVLAVLGALVLALAAGLGAKAGALAAGVDISLWQTLQAGLNTLPVALLFLGLGALLVAAVPRAGAGGAYALVAAAFIWQIVGALVGAPDWSLRLSPFHEVGLVPAAPFRPVAAAVMLAIGLTAALLARWRFRTRDLTGA